MTPTWLSTGLAALMLLAPTPSSGQQDTLAAGQRVLVQVTSDFARFSPRQWQQRRHAGTAVTVGDSMTLTVGAESMALSLSDVERLWVSDAASQRSSYAVKGAGIGLLLGVVVGLSLGESCSEERFICYTRGELAAGFGAGGAVEARCWVRRWVASVGGSCHPSATTQPFSSRRRRDRPGGLCPERRTRAA